MRRLHVVSIATLLLCIACSKGATQQPQPAPSNFQDAQVVIGQPDFASASQDRGAGSVSAAGVHFPVGDAAWGSGSLVLPDTYNHRLLVYHGVPAASGAAADAVLGQPDATSSTPGLALGRFDFPQSVSSDTSGLLVADTAASRVVLGVGAQPVAIGWGGRTGYYWGCAADLLSQPSRSVVAGGKLVVADRSNHRVLVWNQVPASSTPADLAVGQQDLVHCAANDMLGHGTSGGRSARTLRSPTDVWSDGQRLLVVDQGNNRVLLWNHFPTASGAAADVVLGQTDFLLAAAQTTPAGLSGPSAVASDGTRIFVADSRNHRVLAWLAFPSANGQPADVVLGQKDFTHGAANDDDQDGVSGTPTARTLSYPTGVALAGDVLVVTDTYNHRFVVFRVR